MSVFKLVAVSAFLVGLSCGGDDGGSGPGPDGSCTSNGQCADGEYCDFPLNTCGRGLAGTCVRAPDGCGAVYEPACGCDGEVYSNGCVASGMGQDVEEAGGCTLVDYFDCGPLLCASDQTYCRHTGSDVDGEPDDWRCVDLPGGCTGALDCACLAGDFCSDLCEQDGETGQLELTCLGG